MKHSTNDKANYDRGTSMKRIRFVSTGVLLLLLGITAPIYAQQQQDQNKQQQAKDKQQQGQNRQQQGAQQQQPQGQTKQPQQRTQQQPQQQRQTTQPQQRAQQQPQQQRQTTQPQQRVQQQQQANRPSQQGQRVQQGEQQAAWQQHRASSWQSEHRTWQQRGGYNGYRIPDDRFRGYFGSGHAFRIHSYPLELFGGYPRFQYGGFWFSVVDPWPEYWSNDWYDTDDVYIEYSGDGYYLYNRRYPGVGIALSVSL